MAQTTEEVKGLKGKVGVVVRAKTQKTIVVEISRFVKHPSYHKVIRRLKCFMVHDEKGVAKVGDKVRIIETKPMSKLKHWRLAEIVK